MRYVEPLVKELALESASTRKMLERVPEEHFAWKPHPKSMSLCQLASHVAENLAWMSRILEADEFVMNPGEYKPWMARSQSELLKRFDENLKAATRILDSQSNEDVMKPWRFKVGDSVLFEMPKVAVIRMMVFNHSIHHRGQLSVYLRLKDVPLPPVYGPTADEQAM